MVNTTKIKSNTIELANTCIKIVSHSCALISFGKIKILCDPWLFGDVFNNGWSLQLKSTNLELLTNEEINSITHIWISHEHPDHFHFPSLKHLSDKFKNISNLTVLIKKDERTTGKIAPVFKKFGFKKIKFLKHLEKYKIADKLSISIFHHRHIDSALLIFLDNKPLILNLNDAELNKNDCTLIKKKYGNFKILINQFSIAGFDGILDKNILNDTKTSLLKKMVNQHKYLGANVTIPFASFMWFSRDDNKHLNKWHNSLLDVFNFFLREKINCFCLEPPSDYISVENIINRSKKPQFELINIQPLHKDEKISISRDELANLIEKRINELKTYSNSILFSLVEKDFYILVKDENWILKLTNSKSKIICECLESNFYKNVPKMVLNLQPLHFAFSNSFGIQTLGVSGRYIFEGYNEIPKIWRLIRILSSLDNNQTPLRLSTLLRFSLYQTIFERLDTLPGQIIQQLKRFYKQTYS